MHPIRQSIALASIVAVTAFAVAPPASAQISTTRIRETNPVLLATPSPAPIGVLATSRFNAATATGVKLTTLRGLGATSIIIVGGKPMALGDLRTRVRTASLAALGPATMHARSGVINDFHIDAGGTGFGGKKTLSSRSPGTLANAAASKFGTSDSLKLAGTAQESILDPNYCKTHAPYVTGVKGSVTPSGYVVVEGGCFGTSGSIKLLGKFDGGALVLQSQNWDAGSITAAVPLVTGVYDQKVTLEITNAIGVSNDRSLNFIATRETLPLPGHYITATTCDQTYIQAECVDGTGFRLELSNTFSGTDAWHVQAPAGWSITQLAWSGAIGTVNYNGGFDQGGPGDASWTMSWSAGIARKVTSTQSIFGIAVSSDETDFYGSTYGMTVYAVGPAGTLGS